MSAYVKTVDANHMLTVGEEGFYPASSPQAATINPGQKFAVGCGQDFVENHRPAAIDYAATHIWVGELLLLNMNELCPIQAPFDALSIMVVFCWSILA